LTERNYLNSLERPELNYEGIQQDFQKVFDDPKLDLRLCVVASVNLIGTLVAVLSSREDISEADANRIIDSIEGARDSVLQRAERIQQEAQNGFQRLSSKLKSKLLKPESRSRRCLVAI